MYIKAPQITKSITIINGNAPHIKPAKWNEVPEFYRKKKFTKFKPYLFEILLYFVGLTERKWFK